MSIQVKAGAILVGYRGWENDPYIFGKVERVTPSGQVVCNGVKMKERFNSLYQIGFKGYRAPRFDLWTPELQKQIYVSKSLDEIEARIEYLRLLVDWKPRRSKTATLKAVFEIVSKEIQEASE